MNAIELFKHEVQQTLDIPYTSKLAQSSIGLIAEQSSILQIAWEKDLVTGEIVFCMRENEE
ncbi:MAG: hypothetical protein KME21_29075 [Desmonostoc vinosum HA7617-LM4]|jgi:hypothetical protein|nr:hypothetical protein [Desmonostoc vinosum HA7617-LM4]